LSTGTPSQPAGQTAGQTADRTKSTEEESPAILGDTSAACALVAGVSALILSINPDLTAQDVRQILERTADKIVDRQPDAQLGLSLGLYNSDRYSAWFGYGKVNTIKAAQLAQRRILPLPLPSRWFQCVNLEPLEIPDGDAQGATSSIQVSDPSLICDIEVDVELEHEFLGDLELYLISPWGTKILLQGRSLGRLTSLKNTYSLDNTPWLRTVLNRSASGQWQLQVIDWIPENVGRLQRWQLNFGV
jgi:subtilisin-like proprotein convertase family protein